MPTNYSSLAGFGFNPYDPRPDPRAGLSDGTARAGDRRIELGHRHGGQLLGRQRRHRDVGLDPESGQPDDARRHQAHGRPRQPLRRDSDHRRPGHAGADGAVGCRRGDCCSACSKGRRPTPTTPPRAPASRRRATTTRRSCGATALKGARIGIPRAFFYDAVADARHSRHQRRLERSAARGDDRGGRGAAPGGRRSIVDPADIPSVVAGGPAENLLSWGICSGPGDAKGTRRGLLRGLQVRHEARLQRVAAVARRRGAGEDADGAARVEPRQRESKGTLEVRPGAAGQLGRDGRDRRPGALRGGSRQGRAARRDPTVSTPR